MIPVSGRYRNRCVMSRGWLWIVGLFFLSRLLWILLVPTEPASDFATYYRFGGIFSSFSPLSFAVESQSTNMTMQPWGYPFVLAVAFAIAGQSVLIAKLLNVVVGVATLILLWRLAHKLAGKTIAFVTSLLFLCWPAQLMFTSVLASEHLALLMILAGFLSLLSRRLGLAGIFIALAATFRLPCAVALPTMALGAQPIRRLFYSAGFFFLAFALYIGLMYAIYREAPISRGGFNLMLGANYEAGGRWNTEDSAMYATFTSPDRDARAVAWERIKSSPPRYFVLMLEKILTLWSTEDFAANWSSVSNPTVRTVSNIYYYILLATALMGLVVAKEIRRKLLPLATYAGLVSILHSIAVTDPRYHYVAMPAVLLASAWGLVALGHYFASRHAGVDQSTNSP